MTQSRLFQIGFHKPFNEEEGEFASIYDEYLLNEMNLLIPGCDWVAHQEYPSFQEKVEGIDWCLDYVVQVFTKLGANEASLVVDTEQEQVYVKFKMNSFWNIVEGYRNYCYAAADKFKESFLEVSSSGTKPTLCEGTRNINLGDTYSLKRALQCDVYATFYTQTGDYGFPIGFRTLLETLAQEYEEVEKKHPYGIPEDLDMRIYVGKVMAVHY